MGRLVIYGAGGFGRELIRQARRQMAFGEVVFASDDADFIGANINGARVISPTAFRPDDLCVLATASSAVRREMARKCPGFASIIADTAIVYDGVKIGDGAIITDQCIVTADSSTDIGRHFVMNTGATVGHDCMIGDFVTLGPKASCNGNVILEDDVQVGCAAHIRQGTQERPMRIGRGAIIGMGAIVTKDVAPGVTVVGNPAMPMRLRTVAVA